MSFKYKSDYQSKLKSPHWQKKRLQVLQRDKWQCKMCKDEETTLHVHHKEYEPKKEPWEYPMSNFVTLCEHCHTEVELLKDDNHYDEIFIDKILWASGDVTLFIYAKSMEFPAFKFYDKNGIQFRGYQLTTYGEKIISTFFRNCKKLDNYIESKEIKQYLFEKSMSELENQFES